MATSRMMNRFVNAVSQNLEYYSGCETDKWMQRPKILLDFLMDNPDIVLFVMNKHNILYESNIQDIIKDEVSMVWILKKPSEKIPRSSPFYDCRGFMLLVMLKSGYILKIYAESESVEIEAFEYNVIINDNMLNVFKIIRKHTYTKNSFHTELFPLLSEIMLQWSDVDKPEIIITPSPNPMYILMLGLLYLAALYFLITCYKLWEENHEYLNGHLKHIFKF